MTVRDLDFFGSRCNTFITELRIGNSIVNSWYLLSNYNILYTLV